MKTQATVIGNYEKLSILTRNLREAAIRGELDQLADIQQQRASVVEAMKKNDSETSLDEAASRRKSTLIAQILADEAEVRDRVKARMSEMEAELQEGRQELRLLREYRKHVV